MTDGFAAKGLWAAIFALVYLTGCGGESPPQTPDARPPAPQGIPRSQEIGVVPPTVRTACTEIAAMLEAYPAVSLTVSERVVTDYLADRSAPGCRVRLVGERSRYADAARPDDMARRNLPREGWREHLRYAADGPDGTGFALQTEDVTCLFQGMWDGGDDADPTYVPADWYALEVDCLASEPDRSEPRP